MSRGFFELLGHPFALGRPFSDEEVEGSVANVVVLSHELFTRRFGGDPSIIGRTIVLDDATYEVVGVTRPGAGYPRNVELWVPQAFPPDEPLSKYPRWRLFFPVVGRLADGVPLSVAQAEMDAIAARLEAAYPEANRGLGIRLEPLHETIVGDVRTPLLVLLGAVAVVLLIVVVNVANLLLARGTARAHELAARLALGAGPGRIVRQVLAEGALIGVAGGLAGAALTAAGVAALVAAGPPGLPRLDEVHPDWKILGVALAVALGATLLFGLVPALQASRVDPAVNLRKSTHGASSAALGRVRSAFVAGQFALALVLLVGSGLLIRTAGDPLSLAPAVRRVIQDIDPNLPVSRVQTLEQALSDQLAPRRFVSWLLGIFALAALTLAAIGIFGVMAYVVGRRTREIGIRVALGATRPRLLFNVLREGMLQVGAGLGLGMLASLGLTRLVRSQLFGLEATDPATFAAASALLLVVAGVACALPARRAAAVDAIVALREE